MLSRVVGVQDPAHAYPPSGDALHENHPAPAYEVVWGTHKSGGAHAAFSMVRCRVR
jgi:hypothetical protein